jgi:hypothetical protein
MCKRVSRFDFGKADVVEMIGRLFSEATVSTSAFRNQKFYDVIYECFEHDVTKYIVEYSTVKYTCFDRELHDVANNKLKLFTFVPCPNRVSTTRLSAVFGNLEAILRVFTV